MDWQLAVLSRLIVAYVFFQILLKTVVGKSRRHERYFFQYVFTLALSVLWVAISGGFQQLDEKFLIAVAIGFGVGIGTWFSWKAVAISQSRNAMMTFLDDVIAMSLATAFLHEARFLNWFGAVGVLLSVLSVVLFLRLGWLRRGDGSTAEIPPKFYVYVGVYSILWGLAVFGQRYWSLKEMPISIFALGWYTGTFLFAGLNLALKGKEDGTEPRLGARGLMECLALGVFIMASLALASVSYRAPQVVVQPVYLVSEAIIPALIGLFVFNETKQIKGWAEWMYLLIATIGVVLIAVNMFTLAN